jgi:Calcipressin
VSFFDEASAISIRQILDGEEIMGERIRVYFGQPTSIEEKDEHLPLPDTGKLFFISPPPSPPHGWEMKLEGAPNKQVHAEDLAEALAKLHHRPRTDLPASPAADGRADCRRQRSGSSTMIYHPSDHGDSPLLPAIEVEDFTTDFEKMGSVGTDQRPILAHTVRPPLELMDES